MNEQNLNLNIEVNTSATKDKFSQETLDVLNKIFELVGDIESVKQVVSKEIGEYLSMLILFQLDQIFFKEPGDRESFKNFISELTSLESGEEQIKKIDQKLAQDGEEFWSKIEKKLTADLLNEIINRFQKKLEGLKEVKSSLEKR